MRSATRTEYEKGFEQFKREVLKEMEDPNVKTTKL
jgi:hypothetical protein